MQAIKAGADDFLTKPVASDDLFRAIEKAFANHQTLRDLKDKLESGRARLGRLTPREREVFELVIGGEPNKQIARAIGCHARKDCRGKEAGARPTQDRCSKRRQGSSGHALPKCVVHGQGARAQ